MKALDFHLNQIAAERTAYAERLMLLLSETGREEEIEAYAEMIRRLNSAGRSWAVLFADIDPVTLNLDPEAVEGAVDRTAEGWSGTGQPWEYDHNRYDRADWVGAVDKGWLDAGKGRCEMRLSRRADVDALWNDIVDRIVRTVSVGYKIVERVLVKKNDKGNK